MSLPCKQEEVIIRLSEGLMKIMKFYEIIFLHNIPLIKIVGDYLRMERTSLDCLDLLVTIPHYLYELVGALHRTRHHTVRLRHRHTNSQSQHRTFGTHNKTHTDSHHSMRLRHTERHTQSHHKLHLRHTESSQIMSAETHRNAHTE